MNRRTSTTGFSVNRLLRFVGAIVACVAFLQATAISQTVYPNPSSVNLQTAAGYRILAGVSVTVGVGTTVQGDVGVSPGATVTNNGTITGSSHLNTAPAIQAQLDLTAAYNDAVGRTADATVASELGSTILGRGIYTSAAGTFAITGNVTLTGTATDIFIFQMATTLTANVGSSVTLTGGAVWSNVFWVVGSSATVDGDFKGVIVALTSITQTAGTSVFEGRALARNGSTVVGGVSVLPVQLVSFTAQGNRLGAVLRWSTATEKDNYGFEVERRAIANFESTIADYRKIAFVAGAGTSTSARDYSYTDANVAPGRYAYRIKQIDRDGSSAAFTEAEVAVGVAEKMLVLEPNYPNPFNPSTTMAFSIANDAVTTLSVYNLLGQNVMTLFNGQATAGIMYQVVFDASSLPSGSYVARLESGGQQVVRGMVLMK